MAAGRLTASARRPPLAAAAVVALTAAGSLYANHTLASDLFWLLADGRQVVHHGFSQTDPFLTLSHGRVWLNQQWLTAVLFYGLQRAVGFTGLSVLYAGLIGCAVAPLVWGSRHRRRGEVLLCCALTAPTLVAVLDVRAAGFSLLAFSLLIVICGAQRRRWPVWLVPLIFLVWAQLHAAFAAGLLFIALVVAGSAWDAWRGRTGWTFSRRFLWFGFAPVAVFLTPIGPRVLTYMHVLASDQAVLQVISLEWQPTWWHPLLTAYVLLVAGFCVWLWRSQPGPRASEPLIVALGFCAFSMTATRQLIWLGPVCFYVLRTCGRPGVFTLPWRATVPVVAAAVAAVVCWVALLAPARPEPGLMTEAVAFAAQHPPCSGRVAVTPGPGSVLLWLGPQVPSLTDGRIEAYTAYEIDGSYTIVNGGPGYQALIRQWDVTGVITRDGNGIRRLERVGFNPVYHAGEGTYLVRPSANPANGVDLPLCER
jgi:hypothetical protein